MNHEELNEQECPPLPRHKDIEKALKKLKIPILAAEVHGMLTAGLCSEISDDAETWFVSLMQHSTKPDKKSQEQLLDLFTATAQQLRSTDYLFTMLLPDDDEPFLVRAEALTVWCQSFIVGLDMLKTHIDRTQKNDLCAAIEAIESLALMPYDQLDESDPEQETNLFEIIENARMAIMVICDELYLASQKTENKTIH